MTSNKYKGFYNPFAIRLRFLMRKQNTKQTELSELLGVTRQSIGKYADGSSLPPVDKIIELANYYNVSTDYILGVGGDFIEDEQRRISETTKKDETYKKRLKTMLEIKMKSIRADKEICKYLSEIIKNVEE